MILATTPVLQGVEVSRHLGLVFGDAVLGLNLVKDILGGLRDLVGGRSATYEQELATARKAALAALSEQARALGADAVIGIAIGCTTIGQNGGMLMVSATGSAVQVQPADRGPWRTGGQPAT